ncbi:tetratricopeptide repeat protein [Seonamhaeicola maritimus]|uniref:Tetratricopeptide repeat protein n=1 Tax=Seonamhaeicola maritimus TaxID=2591822 RepID=A0A5C7GI21_9FLAO|nr:tetratricopeptide repeat protein [Seonamhaeicola maritimus]TXG37236.1 tetratricopeptide repeat protein [Seonamhaeicola maritimus]
MKFKIAISLVFFLAIINVSFAQKDLECKTKLSLFHPDVKSKNFDRAYEHWKFVKDSCPELSIAIYIDGEKILKDKIKRASGIDQKGFVEALVELWKTREVYFPNRTPDGEYQAKTFQIMYNYKSVLKKSNDELYNGFDKAFNTDKKTFTNPKSLYTYFSLVVTLNEEGKKTLKEVFDKYDDVNEKIETEVKNYSINLNKLIEKDDQNIVLTLKEKQRKASYESYLKNYSLISENMAKLLDKKADCPNLIQLYNRDFQAHENDSIWLKRAVSRMYYKECTEDELYEKLAIAYDKVAPSADTKFFVALVLLKKGKTKEAEKYLAQAYELETDSFKKSNLAYRIGLILKKRKSYTKARNYFRNALKLNPSSGKPHLAIADMYHDSANNCGDIPFNKRAVYWLAAKEARKASKVDPTIRNDANKFIKRYEALAPSKEMIFICGCSGQVIKISCWIQSSIIVPEIK